MSAERALRCRDVLTRCSAALGSPEVPLALALWSPEEIVRVPSVMAMAHDAVRAAAASFARPVWPGAYARQFYPEVDKVVAQVVLRAKLCRGPGPRSLQLHQLSPEAPPFSSRSINKAVVSRAVVLGCSGAVVQRLCRMSIVEDPMFRGPHKCVSERWVADAMKRARGARERSANRFVLEKDRAKLRSGASAGALESTALLVRELGAAGFAEEAAALVAQVPKEAMAFRFLDCVLAGAMSSPAAWKRIAAIPGLVRDSLSTSALALVALARRDTESFALLGAPTADAVWGAVHEHGGSMALVLTQLLLFSSNPEVLVGFFAERRLSRWFSVPPLLRGAPREHFAGDTHAAVEAIRREVALGAVPAAKIFAAVRVSHDALPAAQIFAAVRVSHDALRAKNSDLREILGERLTVSLARSVARVSDDPRRVLDLVSMHHHVRGSTQCLLPDQRKKWSFDLMRHVQGPRMLASLFAHAGGNLTCFQSSRASRLDAESRISDESDAALVVAQKEPPSRVCVFLHAFLTAEHPAFPRAAARGARDASRRAEGVRAALFQAASCGNVDVVHFLALRFPLVAAGKFMPKELRLPGLFPRANEGAFEVERFVLPRPPSNPNPWGGLRFWHKLTGALRDDFSSLDLRLPGDAMAVTVACFVLRKMVSHKPPEKKRRGGSPIADEALSAVLAWLKRVRRASSHRCSGVWQLFVDGAVRKCTRFSPIFANMVRRPFRSFLGQEERAAGKVTDGRRAIPASQLLGERAVLEFERALRVHLFELSDKGKEARARREARIWREQESVCGGRCAEELDKFMVEVTLARELASSSDAEEEEEEEEKQAKKRGGGGSTGLCAIDAPERG